MLKEIESDPARESKEFQRANDMVGTFLGDNSLYEFMPFYREKEKCGLKVCYGLEGGLIEKLCNLDKGHAGPCSVEKKHIS